MNAERGEYSPELDMLAKIDRFGLEAITGRKQFYFGELRCLMVAENVAKAYAARKNAENWPAWAMENPILARLLVEAEKLVDG